MWNVCVWALAFVWLNSASYTFTQAVLRRTLTLPGVSSTSDKGQTDSRRARVHTAQPAAAMADPRSPSLTDNQDSDSQSQTRFYRCNYNIFHAVNMRPAAATAKKVL